MAVSFLVMTKLPAGSRRSGRAAELSAAKAAANAAVSSVTPSPLAPNVEMLATTVKEAVPSGGAASPAA